MEDLQGQIEQRLSDLDPAIELIALEQPAGETLRLYIDHPDGVSLALCERVTRVLAPVRATYSLEVSSPGTERPLTKPDHFRRYLGRRARLRTRAPLRGSERRSVTGELVGASDDEVTVAAPDGVLAIAYADIQRSNLVEGL